ASDDCERDGDQAIEADFHFGELLSCCEGTVYSGNPSRNCSDFIGRQIPIPLLAEERWREAPAWSVRQNVSAALSIITASRYRARASRPSAAFRWLRDFISPL